MGPMGPTQPKRFGGFRWKLVEFCPPNWVIHHPQKVLFIYMNHQYIYINIYFANFLVIHHWIWNFTHFGFFLWLRVAHFETSFESSFKTFQSHSIREIHG